MPIGDISDSERPVTWSASFIDVSGSRIRTACLISAVVSVLAGIAQAEAPRELRLTFVGDIMGHNVNYQMKDFHNIYQGLRDVIAADNLTFANLEFPLDPFRPQSGYPSFNGTVAYLSAAIDSGFNLFSLANNHAFDWGEEGISQTIRALESARAHSSVPFGTRGQVTMQHRFSGLRPSS